MKEKYELLFWQDNEYVVHEIMPNGEVKIDYVFKGTLEQINAWLSLKEKGFDL